MVNITMKLLEIAKQTFILDGFRVFGSVSGKERNEVFDLEVKFIILSVT